MDRRAFLTRLGRGAAVLVAAPVLGETYSLLVPAEPKVMVPVGELPWRSGGGAGWGDRFLTSAEIACIVPIPAALLFDEDDDLWSEVA